MQSFSLMAPAKQLTVNATTGQSPQAIKTSSATGRERGIDAIANGDLAHIASDLDHATYEFMPHHSARIESLFSAKKRMQIRSTHASHLDLDDRILRIQQLRVRELDPVNALNALKTYASHGVLLMGSDEFFAKSFFQKSYWPKRAGENGSASM
jgi:hypothetical protein